MRVFEPVSAIVWSFVCLCCLHAHLTAAKPSPQYVSDLIPQGSVQCEQQWGNLGLDVAAYGNGPKMPIRIVDTTFEKGIGHHANGRITIPLAGAYQAFRAHLGVQWQGGKRGSVRFRVLVDGKTVFEHGPMSDSSPAVPVDIPLTDAVELVLVAEDNGNGIGCDMATWADARLIPDPNVPVAMFGLAKLTLDGNVVPQRSTQWADGLSVIAIPAGPQLLLEGDPVRLIDVSLRDNEEARLAIPVNSSAAMRLAADVTLRSGSAAKATLTVGQESSSKTLTPGQTVTLEAEIDVTHPSSEVVISLSGAGAEGMPRSFRPRGEPSSSTVIPGMSGGKGPSSDYGGGPPLSRSHGHAQHPLSFGASGAEVGVRLDRLRYQLSGRRWMKIPLNVGPPPREQLPPPALPEFRPALVQALIECDWRLHDGINTPREAVTWQEATAAVLTSGDRLVAQLTNRHVMPADLLRDWQACQAQAKSLAAESDAGERAWEALWSHVHAVRRRVVFANPDVPSVPILFAKQVPSGFSHQLTQYYGMWARPGGGVFLLESPGTSMACQELTGGQLPIGSYQNPELSYDGNHVLFAYCALDSVKLKKVGGWKLNADAYYQLYEIAADGAGLRRITDNPSDDFFPTYLPGGRILFSSTRRGGFHRCGHGPCPVYTLASINPDGSDPRILSCHETQEWDPAVLNDGRVIYTRWDYVDRNAVYYQQLWTTRPDGTAPSEFYGNYVRNPVGIWEARPIPGVNTVMATAAAHHAMTAGSIIRLDITHGLDSYDAITRLTPDVPFPESEAPVLRRRNSAAGWRGTAGVKEKRPVPRAQKRWPGHCYRSPYPLSETVFLAAYSYDPLIGEPSANSANMFGLYVVDCYGNRELLYRDPNICSLWPIPLRPRQRPTVIPDVCAGPNQVTGTFVVQDVSRSDPPLPVGQENTIKQLRVIQVLPKTTPHANNPRVGQANASPGKQVLGTVPVEADGSAHFQAPANTPLLFQALDEHGRSVHSMRSITYLQPGETLSCIGCHEPRLSAPPFQSTLMAVRRPPSTITPGPDGSKPFSYPLLVQPVLDKHCIACHSGPKPAGGISLTAKPEKRFTESYNRLVKLASYSAWGRRDNSEPMSQPDHFGARASRLMAHLLKGHKEVKLSENDMERLITWLDATALFYGTFNPEDQAKQRKGERIAGPDLE